MPRYEFQYRHCPQEFECLLQVDEDYAGLACPRCSERSPKKRFLLAAFSCSNFIDEALFHKIVLGRRALPELACSCCPD